MELSELLQVLPEAQVQGNTDLEVTNLAYDSRKIKEKGLFVAIFGHKTDGHGFIDQAILKGAQVVVIEKEGVPVPPSITLVKVKNSRQALSRLSACFFGYPASRLHLIGITGTNGKTTTSYLVESILKTAGFSVGVLGTIDYRYGSKVRAAPVTTPESLDLQGILADMVLENITHVVMEASSHALDQGRLGDVCFEQAVFTNLSQDHLDYHPDMEGYFQAKTGLFTHHLKPGAEGLAIINRDDPYGQRLWTEWKGPKQDFGLEKQAAYFPLEVHSDLEGVRGRIQTIQGIYPIKSSLIGDYNMYNILAAWAVGEGFGLDGAIIQKGIESLSSVPGRMELVPNNKGLTILVDYSHTPEALRFALLSLKKYGRGKILTVFGCGGDRDPHKRPLMGRLAGEFSDLTVVTTDNPRSEDPNKIIEDIEQGLKEQALPHFDREGLREIPGSSGYVVRPDRREAIALAVRLAKPGDVILIAGKGHETYQVLGNETIHFDDREEARMSLEANDVQHR
ncbi:MAG: UDP-N-acetylmuramoyl-L-alanyl-D-glutamate--2,6-diaminopimelate ligase [Desulfobacca sp.]|nr:UDP-N-acetylmuramoyl-L-alanyl-D-glutamate--2,6-diaminopimelate ligase [Desulfobacca sp.]